MTERSDTAGRHASDNLAILAGGSTAFAAARRGSELGRMSAC